MDLFAAAEARERRDRAIALHSKKKAGREFLRYAEEVAIMLWARNGSVTADDVRAVAGSPPKECDGRIMGKIFANKRWKKIGWENSTRGVNHARPIGRFEYVGVEAQRQTTIR